LRSGFFFFFFFEDKFKEFIEDEAIP